MGKPINLPVPGPLGNFAAGGLVLAARGGSDFIVGDMVLNTATGQSGSYTRGVVNGQVFSPTLIPIPAGAIDILYLMASPAATGLFQRAIAQSGPPMGLAATEALGQVQGRLLAKALGPAGLGRADFGNHLVRTFKLGPGRILAVLDRATLEVREGESTRQGPLAVIGPPSATSSVAALGWVEAVAKACASDWGISLQKPQSEQAVTVSRAVMAATHEMTMGAPTR